MKKKIKNIFFSLLIAIALMLSSNFSLAFSVVNSLKNLSFAEYKPTDFITPYEFSSDSGWKGYSPDEDIKKDNFGQSISATNLSKLTSDKPLTHYKGDSTQVEDGSLNDFGAMMIKAENAPIKYDTVEKDDDGNIVFQKNGNDFVYEKEADNVTNKVYDSISGDESYFVAVEGETGKYYKKIVVNMGITYKIQKEL